MLTGGPGTGKTTTVAGLLALLAEQAEHSTGPAAPADRADAPRPARRRPGCSSRSTPRPRTGCRRPTATGSAACSASTLHRLLGWRPDSSIRFRHNRDNRLPHDVIVVDETSMVSLTMMARLLEAVRPDARLVLVGDPDQLASVEAGAVLADLVDGLRPALRVAGGAAEHRRTASAARSPTLAQALRDGDADRVIDVLRGRRRRSS